jgi:hypothetical protein
MVPKCIAISSTVVLSLVARPLADHKAPQPRPSLPLAVAVQRGSISGFAEPVELFGRAGRCTCTCAGSCTCAPFLTSFRAPHAPVLASLVPSRAPVLTPDHASGLGLSIGNRQGGNGCEDRKGCDFSEKRKSPSTGNRSDDFTHGQRRLANAYADAIPKCLY